MSPSVCKKLACSFVQYSFTHCSTKHCIHKCMSTGHLYQILCPCNAHIEVTPSTTQHRAEQRPLNHRPRTHHVDNRSHRKQYHCKKLPIPRTEAKRAQLDERNTKPPPSVLKAPTGAGTAHRRTRMPSGRPERGRDD